MDPQRLAAFAARLTEGRAKFKSRVAFCQAAGISRATLRALESGTQHPEPDTVIALAKALNTTPELLTGEQRILPDNPLLKDLTEEDLRIAQMFHHAGVTVKQETIGVLQERQPPQGAHEDLSADATTWAKRLLGLPAGQRYVVSAVIAGMSGAPAHPLDASITRLQVLEQPYLQAAVEAIENLETSQQKKQTEQKKTRSRTSRKSHKTR